MWWCEGRASGVRPQAPGPRQRLPFPPQARGPRPRAFSPWPRWPLLFLIASSLLASCGFHLQGATSMSPVMKVTYVEALDARSPFLATLMRSLRASGSTITLNPDAATAVLHIERDETGQRVLSVSAANKPTEYEIYYRVKYS